MCFCGHPLLGLEFLKFKTDCTDWSEKTFRQIVFVQEKMLRHGFVALVFVLPNLFRTLCQWSY